MENVNISSLYVPAFSPFNRSDADVMLRSSDKVIFYVHRIILALASPVFADMFNLPQSAGQASVMQTVDVAEDSRTLRALLHACYPVSDPELANLEDVRAILDAALKYDMSKVVSLAKRALDPYVSAEPLRVYAIACRLGFEQLAIAAAGESRRLEISGVYVPEFDEISAGCYQRLLHYHSRRTGWEQLIFCCHAAAPLCENSPPGKPADQSDPLFLLDDLDADTVIVASDGVRFHVHQQIINLASPTLKNMLELENSGENNLGEENGRDQVRDGDLWPSKIRRLSVEEKSTVVGPLLRLCHPSGTIALDDFDLMLSLLRAAKKYQMHKAVWIIQSHWRDFAAAKPLPAYFIASSYQWEEQTIYAAGLMLSQTTEEILSSYVTDMEMAPAKSYFHLLQYHRKCCAAISANGTDPLAWVSIETTRNICPSCRYYIQPKWMNECVRNLVKALKERPWPGTVTEGAAFVEAMQTAALSCSECRKRTQQIIYFIKEFGRKVAEIVAKVQL